MTDVYTRDDQAEERPRTWFGNLRTWMRERDEPIGQAVVDFLHFGILIAVLFDLVLLGCILWSIYRGGG